MDIWIMLQDYSDKSSIMNFDTLERLGMDLYIIFLKKNLWLK